LIQLPQDVHLWLDDLVDVDALHVGPAARGPGRVPTAQADDHRFADLRAGQHGQGAQQRVLVAEGHLAVHVAVDPHRDPIGSDDLDGRHARGVLGDDGATWIHSMQPRPEGAGEGKQGHQDDVRQSAPGQQPPAPAGFGPPNPQRQKDQSKQKDEPQRERRAEGADQKRARDQAAEHRADDVGCLHGSGAPADLSQAGLHGALEQRVRESHEEYRRGQEEDRQEQVDQQEL